MTPGEYNEPNVDNRRVVEMGPVAATLVAVAVLTLWHGVISFRGTHKTKADAFLKFSVDSKFTRGSTTVISATKSTGKASVSGHEWP